MIEKIQFKLNGKPIDITVDSDRFILWVLRTDLGYTGTKYGCGIGFCGSCTVLVNDEAVRSCQTTVKEVAGKNVVTIEGLADNSKLHPLQQAFANHDALQCGYCTPGMILTAYSFLRKNPQPSRSDILTGMNDNLCRCGAHNRIVEAIQSVAEEIGRKEIK
jgi:aerobic-type carbon monoxide dehydrogenase small subunit (CoxS/CutS family)